MIDRGTHPTIIGSQTVHLPLVALTESITVALMITVDLGVRFMDVACRDLADEVRALAPDVIVSVATMGIPIGLGVSRELHLDGYVILQKQPKYHLRDSMREPVESITTQGEQQLILDERREPLLRGRRVVLVDDVISTGASTMAALRLLDRAGAEVVGIGAFLTESDEWRETLGDRASLVRALGHIPLFES
ncbi:phosphoribosyltransferase family protein [Salinibacterium sp. ZJ450]|uniref:phosphoribosyltransferase family protein n=1 Tax=Salinibacterium sp. ZJ450 TaxID=2708338 RepID=UPI001CD20F16|nr:phosphoribosyltransferase family protein [Salinibacterium sp. ZJ450]